MTREERQAFFDKTGELLGALHKVGYDFWAITKDKAATTKFHEAIKEMDDKIVKLLYEVSNND